MAEREGFEPPEPFSSTVFKTAAFDHSATSPAGQIVQDSEASVGAERKFIALKRVIRRLEEPLGAVRH